MSPTEPTLNTRGAGHIKTAVTSIGYAFAFLALATLIPLISTTIPGAVAVLGVFLLFIYYSPIEKRSLTGLIQ